MIDAILSGLGGPPEPFRWIAALVLVGLIVAYGLFEFVVGLGARKLWHRLQRRDDE